MNFKDKRYSRAIPFQAAAVWGRRVSLLSAERSQGGGDNGVALAAEGLRIESYEGTYQGADCRRHPHLPRQGGVGLGQEALDVRRVRRDAVADLRLRQGREIPR
jgi:hypothetical protein